MNYIKKYVLYIASLSVVSLGLVAVQPASASALTPSPVVAQQVCASATDACGKFLKNYVNPVITLLTIVVGIAAAISIVTAGIQYSSSADDPGAVTKAKNRIFNTVVGLMGYIFLFAFLQWIIPGGAL